LRLSVFILHSGGCSFSPPFDPPTSLQERLSIFEFALSQSSLSSTGRHSVQVPQPGLLFFILCVCILSLFSVCTDICMCLFCSSALSHFDHLSLGYLIPPPSLHELGRSVSPFSLFFFCPPERSGPTRPRCLPSPLSTSHCPDIPLSLPQFASLSREGLVIFFPRHFLQFFLIFWRPPQMCRFRVSPGGTWERHRQPPLGACTRRAFNFCLT